eukprot:scaffold323767_cov38-Prasinocladus_malaysianus.AAC.1
MFRDVNGEKLHIPPWVIALYLDLNSRQAMLFGGIYEMRVSCNVVYVRSVGGSGLNQLIPTLKSCLDCDEICACIGDCDAAEPTMDI